MTITTIGAPVLCRNRMSGPTVIASDPKSTHEVIFGGANSPDGSDVQPIPEELLRTPQFAKALKLGVLAVEEGEDNAFVANALKAQSDAFWKRNEAEKLTAMESLETPRDDDLVAVQCIGPGTRADTRCDNTIPVRAREKDNKPPLCDQHAGLVDRCVRRGTGDWKVE
jgi:hypothetical protein